MILFEPRTTRKPRKNNISGRGGGALGMITRQFRSLKSRHKRALSEWSTVRREGKCSLSILSIQWYKYRFDGKEKLLTLGKYPDVPLQEARLIALKS